MHAFVQFSPLEYMSGLVTSIKWTEHTSSDGTALPRSGYKLHWLTYKSLSIAFSLACSSAMQWASQWKGPFVKELGETSDQQSETMEHNAANCEVLVPVINHVNEFRRRSPFWRAFKWEDSQGQNLITNYEGLGQRHPAKLHPEKLWENKCLLLLNPNLLHNLLGSNS